MCTDNFDPCFPDQPVVDLYLPVWARLPAFRSKPAFIWAEDHGSSPRRTSTSTRTTLTYGQLNSSADSIASQLLGRLQLRRGDSVVIISSPAGGGLDIIKLLFSCQRAGLVCVPVSQPGDASAMDHLIRVLLQTKPKAVIAHKAPAHTIRTHLLLRTSTKPVWWLFLEDDFQLDQYCVCEEADSTSTSDPTSSNNYIYSGCGPRDVYVVQYTSGATGIPKPVLVTAGSAAHNVREARKSYELQPSSVIVSWLPQFHDCGLMFLLLTVVSGATSVLTSPSSFLNRPRLWLELVTEFRATLTPVPSFALPLVVRRGGGARHHQYLPPGTSTDHHQYALPALDLGSLRNLVLINEPIYRDLIVQFVDEFACVGLLPSCMSPSYGLAENCTFVSTAWTSSSIIKSNSSILMFPSHDGLLPSARLASSTINNNNVEETAGSTEYLAEEIEIVVVDANTMEPVEDGVEGEIWVSSPSNASGYLGYPSLSQQVFMGRLRGTASRRFVRTGDRGVVKLGEDDRDDCRYLFVTGRASDIIEIFKGSCTSSTTDQKHVWHPHYLEKVAYESSSGSLRGGCVAAFELFSRVVVVVAELQKGRDIDDDKVRGGGGAGRVPVVLYESICRSINGALVKHVVELDQVMRLVILVRSGSLPKTTSGKMQRWAAKAKLMRGEILANIVEAALLGPASLPLLGLNNINPTTSKGKLLVKALLSSLPNDHSGSDIQQESHGHLLSQLIMSSL